MEHNTENLEHFSAGQQPEQEQQPYTKRPIGHIILAWVLVAVVLFGFLGSCYWMAKF